MPGATQAVMAPVTAAISTPIPFLLHPASYSVLWSGWNQGFQTRLSCSSSLRALPSHPAVLWDRPVTPDLFISGAKGSLLLCFRNYLGLTTYFCQVKNLSKKTNTTIATCFIVIKSIHPIKWTVVTLFKRTDLGREHIPLPCSQHSRWSVRLPPPPPPGLATTGPHLSL